MPKTFDELTAWWGSCSNPGLMNEKAKRLLLFTPEKESYISIFNSWNNVIHCESQAGCGMNDIDYERIVDIIVGLV